MRYLTINLFCASVDVATIYLVITGHPYYAGFAMLINTVIATGMFNEITTFSKTSAPYLIYTLTFISGLVATIYLLQNSHPYWAGAKLTSVFFGVGIGISSTIRNSSRITFLPGGIFIAIGGLAAVTYLVIQNHPFWALAIILVTLICSLIGRDF